MDLKQYVNLDHHIYVSDDYLETFLNKGDIYLKRSQYSDDMDNIERDFNYIARYKIEKNDRDKKSDAAIHVHIAKIDVKKKQDKVMTKTFAYFIHELLESFPDEKIEISLHQSASEVDYKEFPIYQKLLTQVFESGEIPYIYDVFTVDHRQQDLAYYKKLMNESNYQVRVVRQEDYKQLPIDRVIRKQEAIHYLKRMIILDLIINNRDLSIQEIQKLQSKYTSMKKTEKRNRFTLQKITNISNDEQLLKLGDQYNSYSARYDNTVRVLSDKDINEIYLVLKNDTEYMTNLDEFINDQIEVKEFIY